MYNHTRLAFGEMPGLDALSDDGRADGIYEFVFSAALGPNAVGWLRDPRGVNQMLPATSDVS